MPLFEDPVIISSGLVQALGADPSNSFQLDASASPVIGVYRNFRVTVTTAGVSESASIYSYADGRIVTLATDLSTPVTTASTYVIKSLVQPIAGTSRVSFSGPVPNDPEP